MDLLMLGQVVVADEGFPALVALVALVVVVDPEVESVGAAVTEALAADAAQVRLLAAVDPQVLLQRRPVGWFSLPISASTRRKEAGTQQVSPLPHRFPTDEAGPLPLASVRALDVPLSVARVVKLPPTDLAGERTYGENRSATVDLAGLTWIIQHVSVTVARFVTVLSPKWNFSWCFNLANLDLKYSSQREHLKGRSWLWRIMCSCR